MTRIDFTPMFRTTVGFDRMMNVMDSMMKLDGQAIDYPPYNIEKIGDDDYRITLAVAGFAEADLQIDLRDDTLFVRGTAPKPDQEREFLHRGIAAGDFERRFALADHVKVTGARLDNGVLTIDLVHELPEAKRPRRIEIQAAAPAGRIGADAPGSEVKAIKSAA